MSQEARAHSSQGDANRASAASARNHLARRGNPSTPLWVTGRPRSPNLLYAVRLASGTGDGVHNAHTISSICQGGIAAMELVTRSRDQFYMARALSFAGVEYEDPGIELTPAVIEICDTLRQCLVHHPLEHGKALHWRRRWSREQFTLNSGRAVSVRSRFESTKQRFFGQVLLSMKLSQRSSPRSASIWRRASRWCFNW